MMSLSKAWACISKEIYRKEFIDELAEFLKKQQVNRILECGCGDGNVLRGLAERGFSGIGIDGSSEMIEIASQDNNHLNLDYVHLDWLDLKRISGQYDCVMCRGNSLPYVNSWNRDSSFDSQYVQEEINESLRVMWNRLSQNGLLYVDTVKESDFKERSREVNLSSPEIKLKGRIDINLEKRIRKVYGEGIVCGERFSGGTESYLLIPEELEGYITKLNPKKIWMPNLNHEINYQVICAKK